MTVSILLGRTEAFKEKAIFLGVGVRIKLGVIGGGGNLGIEQGGYQ